MDPDSFGDIGSANMDRIQAAHDKHHDTLTQVYAELARMRVRPWVVEGAGTNFSPAPNDTVVCVGGDGTVLSASHCCGASNRLMMINSDPERSVGRFSSATVDDLWLALEPGGPTTLVPRMTVEVNGRVVNNRVLNEVLFSHACPAAMTRILIGVRRISCSGIWIGTSAGSTGAIKSSGGFAMPITDDKLQMVVREPFGEEPYHPLLGPEFSVESRIVEGTLYLDGPFLRVPVGFGSTMRFTQSSEPLMMLGPKLAV